MTRSELITALRERFPDLGADDINLAVKALLAAMTAALALGQRIEIRGFGAFSVRQRAPRVGRNPKSGAAVVVPAKSVPHFKPSQDLVQPVPPAPASPPPPGKSS